MGNAILNKAKYTNDTDEWYTTYETIENEVSHYKNQFSGKVILCNCDDPVQSNFSYYFMKNFNALKLRKLICTSYYHSKIDRLSTTNCLGQYEFTDEDGEKLAVGKGYVAELTYIDDKIEISDESIIKALRKKGTIRKLIGNGDFKSRECVEYLQQSDIVVTNPPFSLFIELFSLLVKYDKKFLIIGNQNALTYKEIFPYVKENKVWVGYQFGDMSFMVPNDTEPRSTRYWEDEKGQKWRSLGNAMWLTNLDSPKRHQKLLLKKQYSPDLYQKYDGHDIINVSKVADIPMGYDGIMGVPLTYFKYHNEEQFEIVGEANHGSDNEFDLFKPIIDGKEQFKKILIRRKPVMEKFADNFNILDLFCGAGGLSYGLHMNKRFKTVIALDFDEKAADTFKKNMPSTEVIVGDITDHNVKNNVIRLSREKRVNMIVGGPPCQGFSMKGKKLGLKDPRNFLFLEYLNVVKELQPEIFIIENVKSILSTAQGWFKNEIIEAINEIGYEVEVGVLNAKCFGVPQSRERAIFICSKLGRIKLPLVDNYKTVSVREAIGDLAYLNSGEGDFEQDYCTDPETEYQKTMRSNSVKLYNHKASNHAKIAIDKLKMIPPEKGKEYLPQEMLGKQQFKSTWGRLKWDEPSPTIDTRFDAASNGRNNHPELNRAITPREAARLQSFPDSFVFYGPKVYIRKQIGNAVPPLLAKAIADQIDRETSEMNEERSDRR